MMIAGKPPKSCHHFRQTVVTLTAFYQASQPNLLIFSVGFRFKRNGLGFAHGDATVASSRKSHAESDVDVECLELSGWIVGESV